MSLYGDGYTGSDKATAVAWGDIAEFEARGYIYSDLDLIFKPTPLYLNHGLSADVARKFDGNAIKQSIKNIVLTNRYERPWKPSLGCNIRDYLFENPDAIFMRYSIRDSIETNLKRWEPRAIVEDILIDFEEDQELMIQIIYKLKPITEDSGSETVSIKVAMERIR